MLHDTDYRILDAWLNFNFTCAIFQRRTGTTPNEYRLYAPQGTLCMCGRFTTNNNYASEGLSEDRCREKCGVNGKNRCGGTGSNSIFRLGETSQFLVVTLLHSSIRYMSFHIVKIYIPDEKSLCESCRMISSAMVVCMYKLLCEDCHQSPKS